MESDLHLGYVLDKIKYREEHFPDEDWLVLVVTDHGRDTEGCGHGHHSP